jgi:tetratricopeptide (TPR) repeat protein
MERFEQRTGEPADSLPVKWWAPSRRSLAAQALCAALLQVVLAGCSKPQTNTPIGPPPIPPSHLDHVQVSLIEEGRKQVTHSPQSADAWGRLGQSYHAVEFHKEAVECYTQAVNLDPRAPRWLYLRGLLQLQDQPEAGLASLERAVALVDAEPDAPRLRLAQALVERGQWEAARLHLRRLLDVNPEHPAARLEWARILLADQALDNAAQALAPCLTNAHTARPALMLLAQIRQRQGQAEVATKLARQAAAMPRQFDWPDPYLREVLRLRVDRQKLQDHINSLLVRQQLSEAEEALNKLLGAFPGDPEGLLLLGRLRLQERKCAEAEKIIRQHLTVQTNSLNGLIQLALSILCQERWNDAADVLRQAIALKHDFAQAHFNLGYAQARAGDTEAAIRSYAEALRCNPGDVNTHVALAEQLFRTGQMAEAETHLRRALELDPAHAKARLLRQRYPTSP